ncbi:hypothetical protein SAMN05519103_07243 [Rhizobiales bacterium GAS113]|nr:hypothetical protein SAMN05519103_07243 [Rhizobiales bacterium GAS113]
MNMKSTVTPELIDLEAPGTWPAPLTEFLAAHHKLFLDWEIGGGEGVSPQQFDQAVCALGKLLSGYAIRGWHCTRLTNAEIQAIQTEGMGLPDAIMLARRIDALAHAGQITPSAAALLKSNNQAHEDNRVGRVWFCFFPPSRADESGIGDFFRYWGGEALYNSHDRDPAMAAMLGRLGTPCIVEADVPVALLGSTIGPALKVVRRFLVSRGYETVEPADHEDRITHPLPAASVRRVIRHPTPEFERLTKCETWRQPLWSTKAMRPVGVFQSRTGMGQRVDSQESSISNYRAPQVRNGQNLALTLFEAPHSMTDTTKQSEPVEPIDEVPEVPKQALSTYARLWQFETWLRRMVYVELRALRGNGWTEEIPQLGKSFESDKRLVHMPTPEMDALSYAPLSTLEKAIERNWNLFQPYLPPDTIWKAKLEEISQIRHRVAHFRVGHEDDLRRLLQFLRDLDRGFWRFCTSYNDARPALPPSDDPVAGHFLHLDSFPWTQFQDNKWARVGFADPSLILSVSIQALQRPWAEAASSFEGVPGYLYDVHIHARDGRTFDYASFLEGTKLLHHEFAHICLDRLDNHVRLTIPAVLGRQRVIELIERCLEVGGHTVGRGGYREGQAQRLADQWPEYVLGPDNPLVFLAPGMECSFFGA